MASTKKYASTKRFGAKYGRRLREKLGEVEEEQRKRHICPYCHAKAVKRISVGIWNCRKCKAKFTGKAYSVAKKIVFKDKDAEETAIQHELEPQEEEAMEEEAAQ